MFLPQWLTGGMDRVRCTMQSSECTSHSPMHGLRRQGKYSVFHPVCRHALLRPFGKSCTCCSCEKQTAKLPKRCLYNLRIEWMKSAVVRQRKTMHGSLRSLEPHITYAICKWTEEDHGRGRSGSYALNRCEALKTMKAISRLTKK